MKPNLRIVEHISALLICIFLCSIVNISKAVNIEGHIQAVKGSVESAVIHSVMDGCRLDMHTVDSNGKYKLKLNYNHKYELIFALKGSYSQKVIIETLIPDEILLSNVEFPPITFDIKLFSVAEGIKLSFINNPLRKYYYNHRLNDFVSDIYSDDEEIDSQIQDAISQTNYIRTETEFLSKLPKYELANLKREYEKILKKAGIIYDKNPTLLALGTNSNLNNFLPRNKITGSVNTELNELINIISATKELDKLHPENFNELIEEGDIRFNKNQYLTARIYYKRALSIDPNNAFVQGQCLLLDELIKKQLTNEQYMNLIAFADNSYNEMLYSVAAEKYRYAQNVKPGENYAKNRIDRIKDILVSENKKAGKSESYKQTLKEAETMYHRQFYEKSIASYNHALIIKPGDSYSQKKIAEINIEMEKLADKLMYEKLIISANRLYKKDEYKQAIKEYFSANEIVPNDHYALIRINALEQKIRREEEFEDFIFEGNELFAAGEYNKSKENYMQALRIKPEERYPKTRINEIDKLALSETIVNKTLLTDNPDPTEISNVLYNSNESEKELAGRKNSSHEITEASESSFSKKESKNMGVETETEIENIYDQYLIIADQLFEENKYIDSRNWYYKAWDVKRNENYPKQRIGNINQILKSITKNQADKEYLQFIDLADSTFRNNQYAVARGWYNRALGVKANEQYPRDQLLEIENKITERMAGQSGQQFEDDLKKANTAFKSKNYNVARFWYKKALELRPDNSMIKDKLFQIEQIIQN